MADPVTFANYERDIEQALIALKKGTQLIKYSRKGKPKFCPFRISPDETTLIWYSRGEERNLKLSSVTRIIAGQRTAVFRRYLRPEKDYLSFSLLYKNGERSLDLICKDKAESDLWFSGLKALISPGQRTRRTRSNLSDFSDYGDFLQNARSSDATLDAFSNLSRNHNGRASVELNSGDSSFYLISSDVGSDRTNMQPRTSGADGFRLSVSSAAPSYSSQGSGQDDIESLGDVYIWGEVCCDRNLSDGSSSHIPSKTDVLLPKPLETNFVLDVHQISSGARHAALVTRQGEVFTWGEQSGGRLGHGVDGDPSRPHLVEFLAVSNVDSVACGEYHTCAISMSGDLFTWGDGSYHAGVLGNCTGISHSIPTRLSGPLEGLQVLSIACGTWHSALATTNGKLFTFGDGTFGVLGHGDRESVAYPREVEALSGVKTVRVACGVWHTAAIAEVQGQSGSHIISRNLFTWGDGDKYRLGHGDKEARLVPTCIPSLSDYSFQNMACGENITVALTTSGHVFTMGSTDFGQLGNPLSNGKLPCLIQDKLVGQFVEEVSCGSCHVAVLTSRSEVFTWGCGLNGRLGHGDIEDRKAPTFVEALKDRHVKSISCGSNFTTSICIHKWVSGADQSLCSGCRQAFGFTRKRHNCYHCGLVHCHACSSRKALKAALAPTPGKPHRVCDSCFMKLKSSENGSVSTVRKNVGPRRSIDGGERFDRVDLRSSRPLISPIMDPLKPVRQKGRSDSVSMTGSSQFSSFSQFKDTSSLSSWTIPQNSLKPVVTSSPKASGNSRPTSPYARKPSPPRSATPVFSKSLIDSLKKTNELLNQEVLKLQGQVKNLKEKCDYQNLELQKSERRALEAASLADEESSKCILAMRVVKSTAAQLKGMTETLPPEVYDSEALRTMHTNIEALLHPSEVSSSMTEPEKLKMDTTNEQDLRTVDNRDHRGVLNQSQNSEGNQPSAFDTRDSASNRSLENGSRTPRNSSLKNGDELVEQFEPGVYISLIQLRNGAKLFKRVRFSKRKFDEQQASDWWNENGSKVFLKYNNSGTDNASTGSSVNGTNPDEEEAKSSFKHLDYSNS